MENNVNVRESRREQENYMKFTFVLMLVCRTFGSFNFLLWMKSIIRGLRKMTSENLHFIMKAKVVNIFPLSRISVLWDFNEGFSLFPRLICFIWLMWINQTTTPFSFDCFLHEIPQVRKPPVAKGPPWKCSRPKTHISSSTSTAGNGRTSHYLFISVALWD